MPEAIVNQDAPTDPRISNLDADAGGPLSPTPPFRLTLDESSDDEEEQFLKAILRHYCWRLGADRVLQAVQAISGGGE